MNHHGLKALFLAGAMTASAAVSAQDEPNLNDLPGVPVEVVNSMNQDAAETEQGMPAEGEGSGPEAGSVPQDAGAEATSTPAEAANDAPQLADSPGREGRVSVPVTPGVNEIIPIAVNHLNRVLVPFSDPTVRTTSSADYQIHNRAIYVTTNERSPVTMYVTQAGQEEQALSLTLVPRQIAPVEVSVEIDERADSGEVMAYGSREQAGRWEESQPYVETLRRLLRTTARGEVPQGYSLSTASAAQSYRHCLQQGLGFDFVDGQILTGQRLAVNIGVVRNESDVPIEILEESCAARQTAAVATWPETMLEPGESTEIYVVEHQATPRERDRATQRPRLIGE
jgi:conjugal transfer pilus assembly protein TraK